MTPREAGKKKAKQQQPFASGGQGAAVRGRIPQAGSEKPPGGRLQGLRVQGRSVDWWATLILFQPDWSASLGTDTRSLLPQAFIGSSVPLRKNISFTEK